MNTPKCEVCHVNYQRVLCNGCGKGVCLHCAKAVSDAVVHCKQCVDNGVQVTAKQFVPRSGKVT